MSYNVYYDFCFPGVKSSDPFVPGEKDSYRFSDFVLPSTWMEENYYMTLGQGYSVPVKIRLKAWQAPIVNLIAEYDEVILCGPTQRGKSTMAEGMFYWVWDIDPMNAMMCYAKKDTIESVFDERIKEQILKNPRLSRLYDGNPDNLTKKRMKLRTLVARVASAHVRDDIASFTAPLVYGSEVAKYDEEDYDVIVLLRGRQTAGKERGKTKAIFESSPLKVGDPLHKLMFRDGVLNLEPYHQCPHCKEYQVMVLEQVKEIPNKEGKIDHNANRILQEKAAYYECLHCKQAITDEDRITMDATVRYASKNEKLLQSGELAWPRAKYDVVSVQFGSLVDYNYSLPECLAGFFSSLKSSVTAFKDYMNEKHARFSEIKAEQRDSHWLMAKCGTYKMTDEILPHGVLAVVCCFDTQDKGFWFVMRGFGVGMESWLLDVDFIQCDMSIDASFESVLQRVNGRVARKKLVTPDGENLSIAMELWDRGGHKAKFVDYIVSRRNNAWPYIGSKSERAPLIDLVQSKSLVYYSGNKKELSRGAAKMSERVDWHLPEDVPTDYLNQFVNQYEKKESDRYGNDVVRWIEGGNDHCRDCENLIFACTQVLQLNYSLCDGEEVERLKNELSPQAQAQQAAQQQEPQNQYFAGIQDRWSRRW